MSENQNCPQCKEYMSQMSGVRFPNFPDRKPPFLLCFKCKAWYNMEKQFFTNNMTTVMSENKIIIERVWAMPNHKTFEINPIKELIKKELGDNYTDVFTHPYDRDALEKLREIKTESVNTLAFDPVYSLRQLKEMYQSKGISLTQHETQYYWSDLRTEISRIMKPGSKIISFGWNSIGIGKTNGFEIYRILIVCHGGHHNDTIVTCEEKKQSRLTD